jgi:hypothetical protein
VAASTSVDERADIALRAADRVLGPDAGLIRDVAVFDQEPAAGQVPRLRCDSMGCGGSGKNTGDRAYDGILRHRRRLQTAVRTKPKMIRLPETADGIALRIRPEASGAGSVSVHLPRVDSDHQSAQNWEPMNAQSPTPHPPPRTPPQPPPDPDAPPPMRDPPPPIPIPRPEPPPPQRLGGLLHKFRFSRPHCEMELGEAEQSFRQPEFA